jgi:hypothetical protein
LSVASVKNQAISHGGRLHHQGLVLMAPDCVPRRKCTRRRGALSRAYSRVSPLAPNTMVIRSGHNAQDRTQAKFRLALANPSLTSMESVCRHHASGDILHKCHPKSDPWNRRSAAQTAHTLVADLLVRKHLHTRADCLRLNKKAPVRRNSIFALGFPSTTRNTCGFLDGEPVAHMN